MHGGLEIRDGWGSIGYSVQSEGVCFVHKLHLGLAFISVGLFQRRSLKGPDSTVFEGEKVMLGKLINQKHFQFLQM